MRTRFDDYRDNYRAEVERSISFIHQRLDFFTAAKANALLELVRRQLGDPRTLRALDVGCGLGDIHALLGELGDLHGADVSEELVAHAREQNPSVTYAVYDGTMLPYDDASFDLVFAICVIHHVPHDQWRAFAGQLARVLRPGGVAALIEHNPLNPLTRLAVSRCEFDDDATLLGRRGARALLVDARLEPVESRYIVFFPWQGATLRRIEQRLGRLSLGAQYLAAARRPGSATVEA